MKNLVTTECKNTAILTGSLEEAIKIIEECLNPYMKKYARGIAFDLLNGT